MPETPVRPLPDAAPIPTLTDPLLPNGHDQDEAETDNGYDAVLAEGRRLLRRPYVAAGIEQIARQHSKDRMTVWERIRVLTHEHPHGAVPELGP